LYRGIQNIIRRQRFAEIDTIFFRLELFFKKLLSKSVNPETYYQEAFIQETSFYNFAKALKLYEKAARLGHSEAQYCSGLMYLNGTGIKRSNFKRAFKYIELASLQDNPKAQYLLAKMYYFGEGIARNKDLGNEWMEKFNRHDAKCKVVFSRSQMLFAGVN
jgi:TPR repeat protein